MAVRAFMAAMRTVAHARRFDIESLLLIWTQACIEGTRSLGTLGEHCGAFGLAGLHTLEALRRCQFGEVGAVGLVRRRACRRLRRCGEAAPGTFLRGAELQLFLQRRQALNPMRLPIGKTLGRVTAVHSAMVGCGAGLVDGSLSNRHCRCSGWRRRCQLREGSRGGEGGGGQQAGKENALAKFDHDVASF